MGGGEGEKPVSRVPAYCEACSPIRTAGCADVRPGQRKEVTIGATHERISQDEDAIVCIAMHTHLMLCHNRRQRLELAQDSVELARRLGRVLYGLLVHRARAPRLWRPILRGGGRCRRRQRSGYHLCCRSATAAIPTMLSVVRNAPPKAFRLFLVYTSGPRRHVSQCGTRE